jgi:hypothetical protein
MSDMEQEWKPKGRPQSFVFPFAPDIKTLALTKTWQDHGSGLFLNAG